ncbi:LytR C-terminal domain-containing protein [Sphingomicrobium lutaoense]|uniref:Tetratricopeptide (TPR) repeat protein n=1 Tax=Sphingomicrobium lutaoense TaxID=515949 RepID=A0A839Z4W7_9SPHN|nr:LytR C-terminal domain-containing protein [Sphingomicrobium lutaoense]MBB3764685.1 tetratricopeptide (TPR) repeat protein [Sphingomicrobium lutaoense]
MDKKIAGAMALIAALAACASPMVEVREIRSPLKAGNLPGHERIAEGNGQMRLGNVGLAIESYRKALRSEPDNPAAHAALANAYDHMGRFDLSSRYYQQALALAPERPELYEALAVSLARQGKAIEAARVKAEALARAEALRLRNRASIEMADATEAIEAPPAAPSVTVTLDAPGPKAEARIEPAAPAIAPFAASRAAVATPAAPGRIAAAPIAPRDPLIVGEAPVARLAAAPQRMAAGPVAASNPLIVGEAPVTSLAAAPAQLASAMPVIPNADLAAPQAPPAPAIALPRPEPVPVELARHHEGPRIERMNSGEVALVTAPEPMWKAPTPTPRWKAEVSRPRPDSVTVQYTRLDREPAPVLLVNATGAGAVGVNAQAYLVTRGYRSAELDVAPHLRERTILLYPKGRREDAEALVAELGMKIAYQVGPVERLTLHLGRDAMFRGRHG